MRIVRSFNSLTNVSLIPPLTKHLYLLGKNKPQLMTVWNLVHSAACAAPTATGSPLIIFSVTTSVPSGLIVFVYVTS